ncbi:redoxin domain-containing protein [Natronorarus salvus]|uniref:redoxin domain-containing protein n=1 Tax=Natronorarus salvus TaxID=3117733 RepID=UPI002F265C66
MIAVGQKAPDLSLPGVEGREAHVYDLHREIDAGRAVLLYFYPADFAPVATEELRALDDAGWSGADLTVWGVSGDSIFAHAAFAEEYALTFPLLSDFHAGGADAYGLAYDDWEVHGPAPKRGLVLVDADWEVRYVWSVEDAFEPDETPFARVAGELEALLGREFDPARPRYDPER